MSGPEENVTRVYEKIGEHLIYFQNFQLLNLMSLLS